MLLAIDIGNSTIKFGVFGPDSLTDKFIIPTARDYSVNELLFDRLRLINDRFFQIDQVIVSSVVPEIDQTVSDACRALLNVTPGFVDHTIDLGLEIRYSPAASVGADRLVNASAAASLFGTPAIVCSFGTATTIDVVSAGREFLGGTIAPGMKTMAESLGRSTSKLPAVPIEKPLSVIGDSTEASILAGIYYGQIGLAEGIIRRLTDELTEAPRVIATGGLAAMIANETKMIDIVEENLTLRGLHMLAARI